MVSDSWNGTDEMLHSSSQRRLVELGRLAIVCISLIAYLAVSKPARMLSADIIRVIGERVTR
jgi:hypothetical protein